MVKLLSLPPNLVEQFHRITHTDPQQWFCASDPEGRKVGSGGGTVSLIDEWRRSGGDPCERMIIVHACGESRRLPAYAPMGKVLTPIPVFRWTSGQRVDQTLLTLQMPLYEDIMAAAPERSKALIASGDVLIRIPEGVSRIPDADVVCLGMWANADLASRHGVFVVDRADTSSLTMMLQKPSVETIADVASRNFFLLDIGVWLLSERALAILADRSKRDGELQYYDLYSQFGCALGLNPTVDDEEIRSLSVAIVPVKDGEFYHFGTSRELLSSTLALQSKVADQRYIFQNKIKPNASIFTQNSRVDYHFDRDNSNVWIENSTVGEGWILTANNIVTGLPDNDWSITLAPGICLDMVAIGADGFAIRPYGFNDMMRGSLADATTMWMQSPATQWFAARGLEPMDIDIQNAPIFPVLTDPAQMERVIRWMVMAECASDEQARRIWLDATKLSANDITTRANLERMSGMRSRRLADNISLMARNHATSIFYQLDLDNLAQKITDSAITPPEPIADDADLIKKARNHMLRFKTIGDAAEEARAFECLRRFIVSGMGSEVSQPKLNAYADQIIWSRSPLRIDLAGGWTDTPPYSITHGAAVVNMAIELNGQPPLQCYIKPCAEPHIVIRSIDMSATEVVTTYEQLMDFHRVGSPFSIPKAALVLAGFSNEFSSRHYATLRSRLEDFGSGIELTLLSAVPAGSGLGTSSILASTVLAAISDFANLAWSKIDICRCTFALEQLLTTGGGWQDQYGGVFGGVKLLTTQPGAEQVPVVEWLPDTLFSNPETAECQLLYYTGITRVAKNILTEIVRGMFLNNGDELQLLAKMKRHAREMANAIQRGNFNEYGHLLAKTWTQNQLLDAGTNPACVKTIIDSVADRCLGLKLPGAGGGGFIYMVAKDPEAALSIREQLTRTQLNPGGRFVDISISRTGLQVSRS